MYAYESAKSCAPIGSNPTALHRTVCGVVEPGVAISSSSCRTKLPAMPRVSMLLLRARPPMLRRPDRPACSAAWRACCKLQVTSYKLQATSYKLQATSYKLHAG